MSPYVMTTPYPSSGIGAAVTLTQITSSPGLAMPVSTSSITRFSRIARTLANSSGGITDPSGRMMRQRVVPTFCPTTSPGVVPSRSEALRLISRTFPAVSSR